MCVVVVAVLVMMGHALKKRLLLCDYREWQLSVQRITQ